MVKVKIAKLKTLKNPINKTILKKLYCVRVCKGGGYDYQVVEFFPKHYPSHSATHKNDLYFWKGTQKIKPYTEEGYNRYYPLVKSGSDGVISFDDAVTTINKAISQHDKELSFGEYIFVEAIPTRSWGTVIEEEDAGKKNPIDKNEIYTDGKKYYSFVKVLKAYDWSFTDGYEGKYTLIESYQTVDAFDHYYKRFPGFLDNWGPVPHHIKETKAEMKKWFHEWVEKAGLKQAYPMGKPETTPKKPSQPKEKPHVTTREASSPQDEQRLAKLPGKRISKTGHTYYESRVNRSDTEEERKWHGSRIDQVIRDRTRPNGKLITPEDKKSKRVLTEAQLIKVVKAYGKLIDKEERENSIFFDKCGNVIYHAKGGRKSVSAPAVYYDEAAAHIHNHPSGNQYSTPQSAQDISHLFRYKCPIYIVAAYGKWYMYKEKKAVINPVVSDRIKRDLNKKIDAAGDYVAAYAARANHVGFQVTRGGYCYAKLFTDMSNDMYDKLQKRSYMLYESMAGGKWCELEKKYTKEVLQKYNDTITFTTGDL